MSEANVRHLRQEAVLREVEAVLDAEGESQTIRTKCSRCGAIDEYVPGALRLLSLETTTYLLQRSFEYFCMRCHELDVQVVTEETWLRLLDAGVPVRVTCCVDEAGEVWVRREDPPLATEDVEGWLSDLEEHETLESWEPELRAADDNERSQ